MTFFLISAMAEDLPLQVHRGYKLTPVVALVTSWVFGRTPFELLSLRLGDRKILEGFAFLLELVKAVGEHGLLDLNENDVNERHFVELLASG